MWPERIVEIFHLGIKNLLRNKLRSFLTMLGMIFGVGSVIAMLSVGAGARHEILSRIGELGIRNIIINSAPPPEETKPDNDEKWVSHHGLTFRDADYIRDTIPTVSRLFRVNLVRTRVWHGSRRVEASVLGVEPEHLEMFDLDVSRGRAFNRIDSATVAKVCVVRKGLVRKLKAIADPIGMMLKIGDNSFEVIGVLADEQFRSHTRKALALDNRAQEVYIPYSTSMRTFGILNAFRKAGSNEYSKIELDQIIVQAESADKVLTTSMMTAAVLASLHEKKDYEIVVPLELLKQSEETQRIFNIVMVLIAGISLLVGGIGIANIMLATITERTREIGIRRALGAQRRDIVIQFLTETVAIAAVGGLLGSLFAVIAIDGIVRLTGWKAMIEPHYVAISLLISCTVGIVFGIFPARRASLMDPIKALRHE
jgi:putative ABC transport system permease protein